VKIVLLTLFRDAPVFSKPDWRILPKWWHADSGIFFGNGDLAGSEFEATRHQLYLCPFFHSIVTV
jgi:hypothetical protein